jgi:hypothetical protein
MSLLQIKVDENLKKAIKKKADQYGVPASTLVRIVLVKSFLANDNGEENPGFGNVFNAKRDSKGKGIKIEDFLSEL